MGVKTLLLDTNRASIPIFQSLTKRGDEVWVVGCNPNQPLANICDHYVNLDYSNHDDLDDFIEKENFDYIIPGCTDASYRAYTSLRNKMFKTNDTIEIFDSLNNKYNFRELLASLNIRAPKRVDRSTALNLPSIIVKPVDSFSGQGITKLNNPQVKELDAAINFAYKNSVSGKTIIEEFVEGQLYSHSCFFEDGKIVADFIVREDCVNNPFAVDLSYVDFSFNKTVLLSYRKSIYKVVRHLKIKHGLLHSQFILKGTTFWIIEATRRCPGDLYNLLIEKSTGYQYSENYLASFFGMESIPFIPSKSTRRRIIRYTLCPKFKSTLQKISFNKIVKIDEFYPLIPIGSNLEPGPAGRTAIIFFESECLTSFNDTYSALLDETLCSIN